MPYASRTKVDPIKTRIEIERALTKAGATKFATFTEEGRAAILFALKDRQFRFTVTIPSGEQEKRSRWRALLLCIKAKLESVASGIETFEEAFFAHVVLPDGETLYEHAKPRLAEIARGNSMLLLPPPR